MHDGGVGGGPKAGRGGFSGQVSRRFATLCLHRITTLERYQAELDPERENRDFDRGTSANPDRETSPPASLKYHHAACNNSSHARRSQQIRHEASSQTEEQCTLPSMMTLVLGQSSEA